MQVVSRGRLAPGDGQWSRGGQADQQADQAEGHGARPQGLVQVAGPQGSLNLSAGKLGMYQVLSQS